MNIQKIKDIINTNIPDELKEIYILNVISEDPNVIPTILNILEEERSRNNELILDSNTELSRALVVLKDKNLKYNKKIIADPKWVVDQIILHYKKWQEQIKCGFKMEGLD